MMTLETMRKATIKCRRYKSCKTCRLNSELCNAVSLYDCISQFIECSNDEGKRKLMAFLQERDNEV